MTIQIAVRLPEALVEFIDSEVAAGRSPSRAALVTRALRREQRRWLAERDAEILAADAHGDPDDRAGLAAWAARQPTDMD